MKLSNLLEV